MKSSRAKTVKLTPSGKCKTIYIMYIISYKLFRGFPIMWSSLKWESHLLLTRLHWRKCHLIQVKKNVTLNSQLRGGLTVTSLFKVRSEFFWKGARRMLKNQILNSREGQLPLIWIVFSFFCFHFLLRYPLYSFLFIYSMTTTVLYWYLVVPDILFIFFIFDFFFFFDFFNFFIYYYFFMGFSFLLRYSSG